MQKFDSWFAFMLLQGFMTYSSILYLIWKVILMNWRTPTIISQITDCFKIECTQHVTRIAAIGICLLAHWTEELKNTNLPRNVTPLHYFTILSQKAKIFLYYTYQIWNSQYSKHHQSHHNGQVPHWNSKPEIKE